MNGQRETGDSPPRRQMLKLVSPASRAADYVGDQLVREQPPQA